MSYQKDVMLANQFNSAVDKLCKARGYAFATGFLEAQVRIMLAGMPIEKREAIVDEFVMAADNL